MLKIKSRDEMLKAIWVEYEIEPEVKIEFSVKPMTAMDKGLLLASTKRSDNEDEIIRSIMTDENYINAVCTHTLDWSGVCDEDGKGIPFTVENLKWLLDYPKIGMQIMTFLVDLIVNDTVLEHQKKS